MPTRIGNKMRNSKGIKQAARTVKFWRLVVFE